MTPIVKDLENAAAPTTPGAPAANAPARPQPVALEVPVTVNGARSVEGSDKREPFSESSQTVLVFGHGAVIRIAAVLAPGQLIFLTNEKTKKEVVCQVVKSKTDGNAVGYVELRFTEPAPGFWGQRFPSDTILPQAAPRSAAPAPVAASPKIAPAAVAPPVAAKAVEPPPVIVQQPAVVPPPAPSDFAKELAKATVPFVPPAPPAVEPKVIAPPPAPIAPIAPPAAVAEAQPFIKVKPVVEAAPVVTPVESKPAAPPAPTPTAPSADHSTEELKQQAARLQEQLSSLLFTDAPKGTPTTTTPAASASESVLTPDTAEKILDLTNFVPEAASSKPAKSIPTPPRPMPSSLAVEEIKIPSWLAPLARESETRTSEASAQAEPKSFADAEAVIAESTGEAVSLEAEQISRRPETAVFGGQLLGESSQSASAASSGSKKGLFIGIAATLLLVAGGTWYSRQPGNAISAFLGGSPSALQPTVTPRVEPETSAARPVTPVAKSVAQPVAAATNFTSTPAPVNPPAPVESVPASNPPVAAAPRNTTAVSSPSLRNTPPVEEPKKPSLGDVRLATPTVNHGGASAAPSASEPAIDVNETANTAEPLSSLVTSHSAGPAAPLPVGGDVKSAKLIKSVPPVYPDMAKTQHVAGNVQIDALIDTNGNVSSMNVISGPVLLRRAALDALKQWKYEPAQLDGKPTPMHLTITIQFRAQ
ncbi:MAG TPA: TonB family protein [Candidatus Acidoferrum sp.]|nr:TonB family protein [Candidatus Acidoferrum sp.]